MTVKRVTLTGMDKAIKTLHVTRESVRGDTARRAARAAGMVIQTEWQGLFRDKNEPSIPGIPPRWQTKTYLRSIHVEVVDATRDSATAVIGTDLDYPWFLEFGTSKMAARPIARPAFENKKGEAATAANKVIDAALARARGR